MNYFYSQQGEDIYIYDNFINKTVPDGTFIELGAVDGVIYSNTKFFEDKLKFSGILIEPTNQYIKLIQNRPHCKCYNIAVNYTNEKVKFLGDFATAGLVTTMDEKFKNIWHQDSSEYYVDGEPISEIIKKSNMKYIDLFTIDVEGGELVVLETMDFSIPIYLICIELDGHNIEKDDKCRKILIEQGFVLKKRLAINEFWINENYFRKELLYDTSVPKFKFEEITDLGIFPYIAPHLIYDLEKALKNKE